MPGAEPPGRGAGTRAMRGAPAPTARMIILQVTDFYRVGRGTSDAPTLRMAVFAMAVEELFS